MDIIFFYIKDAHREDADARSPVEVEILSIVNTALESKSKVNIYISEVPSTMS